VVEIAPGSSTWARLSGLQAGVTYSFVVAAANEQGTSKPTPPIAFKMPGLKVSFIVLQERFT
jgi:hypothetical protein